MFPLRSSKYEPIYVTVLVEQAPIVMEVDTGATLSVISESTYSRVWGDTPPPLATSAAKLRTYTGEEIPVKGALEVEVSHAEAKETLTHVTRWAKSVGEELVGGTPNRLEGCVPDPRTGGSDRAHEALFRRELGTITCAKAELHMDPQVSPAFHRPQQVPFAQRQKVEDELIRLEKKGIIRPRKFSEWASPIVPVPKSDGSVHICGDYKISANKAMICDIHPIPTSEDLFAMMAGGMSFTKLDLSHAYLQLQLADSAREYLVINTPKGLFEYTRMPFGIKSAPAIFQRTMDNLLQGLDHVGVYIDDILITGKSEEQHLNEVLSRLEKAGVRLKQEKCVFMADEVTYLGHRLNREGIQPTGAKVEAINQAPKLSELQAFLGMVNFYGKFMENFSTLLAPLYKLPRKGVVWRWGKPQRQAFDGAKELLSSPKLWVHYDTTKELILTCDASPYGLGAVLAHRMEADRVRIQNTGTSRTKLCSDRQGSVGGNVRSEAVPQVPLRTTVRHLLGSQATYLPVRRAQGNIGNCISSSTAVNTPLSINLGTSWQMQMVSEDCQSQQQSLTLHNPSKQSY